MNLLLNLQQRLKLQKKEPENPSPPSPVFWVETSESVSRYYQFEPDAQLSVKILDDSRPAAYRLAESFRNKFFPSGYPHSVNEGLRPTPAQATAVSWILKDGMEHVGKLVCSNLGASMDSEPKRWRILGLGNFAKGMGLVAARATRLPIYSSFAKEGNLSDLFAKGEAISTLFNVVGIGAGIQLASTVCSSMQGKLLVGPLLSVIHIYSVCEEMRAAPVNTLNPQRTALIVADFLKTGKISSPADLRYREDLLFPGKLIKDAGNVKVGSALHLAVRPSKLLQLKETFPEERFLLSFGARCTDLILEHNATGKDALRGWLVAGYAAGMEKSVSDLGESVLKEAYVKMDNVFRPFLSELQAKGWYTDRFLDGIGTRFAF